MPAKFTIGEKSLLIDDVPIKDIQAIATQHNVGWLSLVAESLNDAEILQDLFRLVAKRLETDPPPMDTYRDVLRLMNDIEYVADDLPEVWTDGNPQMVEGQKTD